MHSSVFVVVLVLLGCVMSFASPALPPNPAPASPNSASSFEVSEYEVDSNGLWSDHEIPLSDASIEAIRHATPATPEDIAAWNAEVEPEMQIQAVDDEEADAEAETETDDLEIAHGHEGRMLLIPHSRHFMMRRFITFLTRLIAKMKTHSSLARMTLKLKIEPVTPAPAPTPTPTPPAPTPLPTRIRRPPPSLGIPYRPHPVAVRLIPSRTSLQTRRILTRCSMLLRNAVQKLHQMRQMMMRERMKQRRLGMSGWMIRGLGFPDRGVILFRSNNITATGPTYTSTTMNRLEIEGEKNGTVTIIAPRVNATLSHAVIVINRGTLVLLNRSRNNTFAFSLPPRTEKQDSRRRFPLFPIPSHHIMNEEENQHTA